MGMLSRRAGAVPGTPPPARLMHPAAWDTVDAVQLEHVRVDGAAACLGRLGRPPLLMRRGRTWWRGSRAWRAAGRRRSSCPFNEALVIGDFVEATGPSLPGGSEALVVDDGSTDATPDLLNTLSAGRDLRVVTHDRNRGIGAALATGFRSAIGDVIVTMDADLSHPAELVARLAAGARTPMRSTPAATWRAGRWRACRCGGSPSPASPTA